MMANKPPRVEASGLLSVKKHLRDNLPDRQLENSWHFVKRLAMKFYRCLDTPLSLSCHILLKYDEIEELISRSVRPDDYRDMADFADDYAAVSFLKKYEGFPSDLKLDTERAAFLSAVASEKLCQQTTLVLHSYEPSWFTAECMLYAQRLISNVLQVCPPISRLACDAVPAYGPGASSSCSGAFTSVFDKLKADLHVTAEAKKHAVELLKVCPRLIPEYPIGVSGSFCMPYDLVSVPGNRFTTVPKTAKTDRPICIEPHLNMVMQKLYGDVIRKRFKRFGIDLSTQHQVNISLAKSASSDGLLATVDLSSASDSICTTLVKDLIPTDWFSVLNDLRSKRTSYDKPVKGEAYWHENYKFSSMGNGFTFELESLIFWALAKGVCAVKGAPDSIVSIYGDDIILPAEFSQDLYKVLGYCGFKVNKEKSFDSGYFRESCGADYWDGVNIRPYFVKQGVTHASHLISIANGLRHYATRRMAGIYSDSRFLPVWRYVLDRISSHERTVGPCCLGDSVIWASGFEVPDSIVPTYDAGVYYATQVVDKGKKIRRSAYSDSNYTTGVLMTFRSPSWVWAKFLYGYCYMLHDEGSPVPNRYRVMTHRRKVTRVAVPVGTDSPIWL